MFQCHAYYLNVKCAHQDFAVLNLVCLNLINATQVTSVQEISLLASHLILNVRLDISVQLEVSCNTNVPLDFSRMKSFKQSVNYANLDTIVIIPTAPYFSHIHCHVPLDTIVHLRQPKKISILAQLGPTIVKKNKLVSQIVHFAHQVKFVPNRDCLFQMDSVILVFFVEKVQNPLHQIMKPMDPAQLDPTVN